MAGRNDCSGRRARILRETTLRQTREVSRTQSGDSSVHRHENFSWTFIRPAAVSRQMILED